MQINISETKAKLSELVAAVERGEEVIITRGGNPIARLVPAHAPRVSLGLLKGLVPVESVPNFLSSMPEDELADWGA